MTNKKYKLPNLIIANDTSFKDEFAPYVETIQVTVFPRIIAGGWLLFFFAQKGGDCSRELGTGSRPLRFAR